MPFLALQPVSSPYVPGSATDGGFRPATSTFRGRQTGMRAVAAFPRVTLSPDAGNLGAPLPDWLRVWFTRTLQVAKQ